MRAHRTLRVASETLEGLLPGRPSAITQTILNEKRIMTWTQSGFELRKGSKNLSDRKNQCFPQKYLKNRTLSVIAKASSGKNETQ